MDITIFIAWFKFHNILGSAKKWWLMIAFRQSVKSIQNISCRFLPEDTPLPLLHGPLLPIDCTAASLLCIMNSSCTAYPWLWKRYTNVYMYEWCDSDYEWLTSPPIFLSEVCLNMNSWISRQSFGPIKKNRIRPAYIFFFSGREPTWIEPLIFMGIIIIVKLKG